MKATQKHLDLFEKETLKWLNAFKMSGWDYYFGFDEKDKENTAGTRWNLEARTITFELSRNQGERNLTRQALKDSALHEAIHVVLARLMTLAMSRYVSKSEIKEAAEEAVNTLRNYLSKK